MGRSGEKYREVLNCALEYVSLELKRLITWDKRRQEDSGRHLNGEEGVDKRWIRERYREGEKERRVEGKNERRLIKGG